MMRVSLSYNVVMPSTLPWKSITLPPGHFGIAGCSKIDVANLSSSRLHDVLLYRRPALYRLHGKRAVSFGESPPPDVEHLPRKDASESDGANISSHPRVSMSSC